MLLASVFASILLGCATPAPRDGSSPAVTSANTPPTALPSSTAAPPLTAAATPTMAGVQIMDLAKPLLGLQRALELTNDEMSAAANSADLKAAKRHAEGAVNVLGGYWSRWYGDGDGDGDINDPSDKRGVLPGDRIPEAAPDTRAAEWPIGWAVRVFEDGDENTRQVIESMILGNVNLWKNKPRARYDEMEKAVAGSDVQRQLVGKLDGRAMRAMVWARLILVKAQSLAEAQNYAKSGLQEVGACLEAVRKIKR